MPCRGKPIAADATAALHAALAGEPVDVIVQQAETRRKKILIADMDSTMIDQECIDELADEIGVKDRVAAITARSMNGEIAFEPALRERVALLNGLDAAVVDRIVANRLTLAAGGRALVQTMRANGAWTALVSGGFDVLHDAHRGHARLSGKPRQSAARARAAASPGWSASRSSVAPPRPRRWSKFPRGSA